MKRRLFAVLLAIVMVLAVLPTAVFAADAAPTVYIAGTAYTSGSDAALPSGVTIDWDTKTITLNGANIIYEATSGSTIDSKKMVAALAIIDGNNTWKLSLTDTNTVKAKCSPEQWRHQDKCPTIAVYATGTLNISGTGTLNVDSEFNKGIQSSQNLCAIYASNLNFNSGTINASVTNENAKTSLGTFSLGAINAFNKITVVGGTINVDVKQQGNNAITAAGIRYNGTADENSWSSEVGLVISGGAVNITGNANNSRGIAALTMNITGGTIDIDGSGENDAVEGNTGIYSAFSTISGGSVEISGYSGFGLETNTLQITGESTDVKVSGSSGKLIQVQGATNITAENVEITASGDAKAIYAAGTATDNINISAGSYTGEVYIAPDKNVTLSGSATVVGNVTNEYGEGKITVDGASVTGNIITNKDASVTVSSGIVTGNIIMAGKSDAVDAIASLTISGGTVGGTIAAGAGTAATVSGGSFSESVNPDYLADNLTVELYSNGAYTYHTSINEAESAAAESGDRNAAITDLTSDNPVQQTYVTVTIDPANGESAATSRILSGRTIPEPTAPVKSGYNFIGWSADGVTAVSFPYTVTANVTLTALWEEVKQDNNEMLYWMLLMMMNQKFDMTATAGEGGTITDAGVTQVKFSKDITYTITPDEGYAIADVIVDGKSVGAVSAYTFDNVKKKHTIEAVFVKTAWVNPFADVNENDWFYEDIAYAAENGIMNGVIANDTFAPEAVLDRAALVTMLWRLEGEPITENAVAFSDVPAGEWYTNAVYWASANGIVLGYNGEFSPADALSREQAAAILHRYAVLKGWDDGTALPMVAQYKCSEWAENDVNWAEANGLLDGIGSDMSDLTADATRAEIAAMMRRFCERFLSAE